MSLLSPDVAGDLRVFDVSGCSALEMEPMLGDLLRRCPRLEKLEMSHLNDLVDLSLLSRCVKLKSLTLCGCGSLLDISGVQVCNQLRKLDLRNCGQLVRPWHGEGACTSRRCALACDGITHA